MTFVNPVTSLGAQVTSAGVDVTVQGARPAFDYRRVAHFKLEETAGLVCRNQIRTPLFSFSDFGDLGSTDAYGDIPSGWSRYTSGLEGDETGSCECDPDAGTYTIDFGSGAGITTDNFGLLKNIGVVIGQTYVIELRARIRSAADTVEFRVNLGGAANSVMLTEADIGAGYVNRTAVLTASGVSPNVFVYVNTTGDIVADIDSITITAENAGTPTEDMSGLTAPGISGRGCHLDGTDYISAPWSGGFTYPTSLACAFKLDSLTAAAIRTLLSLTDASASNVYWRLGINTGGTLIAVNRLNTTGDTATAASPLTLDWHTVAVVFHDETSCSVYFDGTLLTTQTGLNSVPASANVDTLLIGVLRLSSPIQYADGITFDEVSAWTRELSAEDAAEWHQFTIFPLAARHSAEPLGLETSFSL